MKFFVILALVATVSAQGGQQNPKVWDALRILRGGRDLTTEEIFDLIANAVPGRDYPVNVYPQTNAVCNNNPGFYAETSSPSNCQTFYRCDDNNYRWDYLCPNGTLFNQITLVCDWFFNVQCQASSQFVTYSNSRLGDQNAVLLDNQDVYEATGAVAAVAYAAPAPAAPVVQRLPVQRVPARGNGRRQ